MTEKRNNLFNSFKKNSKKDWEAQATKDLKGENPFKSFSWQADSNITASPYHDNSDIPSSQYYFQNQLTNINNTNGDIRYWQNMQKISVSNERENNLTILDSLNNGADGIILDVQKAQRVNFSELLKDVLPEFCNVSLNTPHPEVHIPSLLTWFNESKSAEKSMSSLVFSKAEALPSDIKNYPNLKYIEIKHVTNSLATSIAGTLHLLTKVIDYNLAAGHNVETIFDHFFISVELSEKYFEEIAKMRALRQLVYQVAHAYECSSYSLHTLHIHAYSPAWNKEAYMPHANMLQSTTSAMAAVLGGCNSLEVEPEDPKSNFMNRIARNTSSMLKEESYFNKTTDPVAGSYYIETLTDELAKAAWSEFQNLL